MDLEGLRTASVLVRVVVRLIGVVVNWNFHSRSGSQGRQQLRGLEGSASPTDLNQPELVGDEGLLEQDGDHELFEDPFVVI